MPVNPWLRPYKPRLRALNSLMSFSKDEKRIDERKSERIITIEEAKEDARIMTMRTNDFSPDSKEWYKRLKRDGHT